LSALLAPATYQRRTGETSEGGIKIAIQALGEFSTTHMTLNRAHELPGAIVVGHDVDGSLSTVTVMQTILDQKKASNSKKSGASTFAAKCGKLSGLSDKTTIQDLLENKNVENLEIHVDRANHWIGLYDHDLGDKICYP